MQSFKMHRSGRVSSIPVLADTVIVSDKSAVKLHHGNEAGRSVYSSVVAVTIITLGAASERY